MFNKDKSICCCIFSIIAGLLLAAAIAGVFYTGRVVAISVLFYITLIIGILGLIFILFSILCSKKEHCKCLDSLCLIPSLVGSIISSLFALTITTVSTGSFSVALLVGTVAFFLFFSIINILMELICLICSKKECR